MITSNSHGTNEQMSANCDITTPIHLCNPDDIIPRLIKAHKKKIKLVALFTLLITIISIIVTSICFVFVKKNAMKGENIGIPLTFGIIGIIWSVSFLITFCIFVHSLRNDLD